MEIFNILIIIYNFITAIMSYMSDQVNPLSIVMVIFNLVMTFSELKVNRKSTGAKICLAFEILTVIIIIATVL